MYKFIIKRNTEHPNNFFSVIDLLYQTIVPVPEFICNDQSPMSSSSARATPEAGTLTKAAHSNNTVLTRALWPTANRWFVSLVTTVTSALLVS